MKTITVLLADDHEIVREGVRALLESRAGMKVVGEAVNGEQAVRLTRELLPDVAVLDFSMPVLNGAEAARRIRCEIPTTKVIILSCHSDERHVAQSREAGAMGYLGKDIVSAELIRTIHATLLGQSCFDGRDWNRLQPWKEVAIPPPASSVKKPLLSPREIEVLRLIAEGQASKHIAAELSISIKTVDKHRQKLMKKLSIHHVAGLTRYAMLNGLVV